MKLIVLAAGKGERLYPLTKNTPKLLLDLGDGTTLLERQLENAIQCKEIDEVIIITGYKTEQIEAKMKDLYKSIKIRIVYNPFFDISNNLISLWCAYYLMEKEDFIITNGDNIYRDSVYDYIISGATQKQTIQVTIDKKDSYDDDDMKVLLDESGRVVLINKDIDKEKAMGESVGLVLVKGSKCRKLIINKLIQLSKQKEYMNKFWLEVFNSLVNDGIQIDTIEVNKDDFREMDFHPDIEELKEMIKKEYNFDK